MAYLTVSRVFEQEQQVEEVTFQKLGYCLELQVRAIDCLIRMAYWIPVIDDSKEEDQVKLQTRFWLHSATYSFRSAQLLVVKGYYLDAEIINRHLVEVLVKMRYFHKHPDKLKDFRLLMTQKPAPVQFKTMFDEIMPGFYDEYKNSLSYPTHGGLGSHVYRMQHDPPGTRILDTGVLYKELWATAFVNFEYALLLGYLRAYQRIFPDYVCSLTDAEQQELKAVEASLEDSINKHVAFKGGENSWHKATYSIWNC